MLDDKSLKSRFWPVILILLVASTVARMIAYHIIASNEKTIHLTLTSSGGTVTARIDDEESFSIKAEGLPEASQVGLYIYHSYEDSDVGKHTYFSNIIINGPMISESRYVDISRGRNADLSFLAGADGWEFEEGKGVYHAGAAGERALCMMKNIGQRDFTIEVDVTNPVDAGLIFNAHDEHDGLMVVMRSIYNDVFFASLHKCEPGPVLQIRPLKELRAGLEALRLSGLVADLIMKACIFMLILWFFNHLVTVPDIEWARLMEDSLDVWIKSPLFPFFMFFLTALMTASVAYFSLDATPHIADATAYLFQAKIFAAGKLYAEAPPLPEFFDVEHVVVEGGKWFGKYPPLYPAILAIGVKLGAPWAVNPILGALTACIVFLIAKEITKSHECGLLAWGLMMTSPFFLFISASMMSHAPTLLFFALAVYLALLALRKYSMLLATLAGASIGAMIFVRPYTAFLQFWPLALYLILAAERERGVSKAFGLLIAFGMGIVPFALFYIAWNTVYIPNNQQMIGAYALYQDNDVLGFGPNKGCGWLMTWGSWGHTPAKAFRSVYNYLYYTSSFLFGWPFKLSLSFAGLPLIFGKKKRISLYLFSSFLILVVGHMLYWATQHVGYGARYWYTGILAGTILTALGVRTFIEVMRRDDAFMHHDKGNKHKVLMTVMIMVAVMCNGLYYLPERIKEGHNYGNVSASLRRCVESLRLEKGLVFVKTEGLLFNDGFYMNDPFMKTGVIFARDLGDAKNRELMDLYPDCSVYKWDKKFLKLVK